MVAISPMCSVTIASADNNVIGSKCAMNCTERLCASMSA